MADEVMEIGGVSCLVLGDDGEVVRDAGGATDLIGEALVQGARVIAAPVARLDPSFFELRSGLAGELLQKAANYRLKFAIMGDISAQVAASGALRDFVIECNRGRAIFFGADLEALCVWLSESIGGIARP
jgi:hypothetical protein